MSFRATVVKVFLASPGDTVDDRAAVRRGIEQWNAEHGEDRQVVFQAVGWETHTSPEYGDEPQAFINRQALDGCDALVGLLWTTLGSPTKTEASGTVEEIHRFAETGKHVGLFFCNRPLPPEVDTAKVEAVRAFRSEKRDNCLYETYSDAATLERQVQRWLTRRSADHHVALGMRLPASPRRRTSVRLTARLTGTRGSQRIEVRNGGTEDVQDVRVSIPDEVEWMDLVDEGPIGVLRSGESVRLMCSTHFGGGPRFFDLAIDGTDSEGSPIETQYSKISN